MSIKKARVTQSSGDPGRWQAQYYDDSMGLWFDIGDSRATEAEAFEVRMQYLRNQVHAATPNGDDTQSNGSESANTTEHGW